MLEQLGQFPASGARLRRMLDGALADEHDRHRVGADALSMPSRMRLATHSGAQRAIVCDEKPDAMRETRNESFWVAHPFRRCRGRDVVGGAQVLGSAGDSSLWTRGSRL